MSFQEQAHVYTVHSAVTLWVCAQLCVLVDSTAPGCDITTSTVTSKYQGDNVITINTGRVLTKGLVSYFENQATVVLQIFMR